MHLVVQYMGDCILRYMYVLRYPCKTNPPLPSSFQTVHKDIRRYGRVGKVCKGGTDWSSAKQKERTPSSLVSVCLPHMSILHSKASRQLVVDDVARIYTRTRPSDSHQSINWEGWCGCVRPRLDRCRTVGCCCCCCCPRGRFSLSEVISRIQKQPSGLFCILTATLEQRPRCVSIFFPSLSLSLLITLPSLPLQDWGKERKINKGQTNLGEVFPLSSQ